MRTVVYPPPGVFGFGRSRTVGVVASRLDPIDGFRLVEALANRGIPLRVVQDQRRQVLHLHACKPLSTENEVIALRAFAKVTDERLAWHGAEA